MIWHSSKTNEVLQQLTVTKENGLANSVALERLETYGKNTISASDNKSLFERFISQLKSKIVYFLVAVALISVVVDLIYRQNDFYFSLLIIAIAIIACARSNNSYTTLSLQDFNTEIDKAETQLLDVRTSEEHSQGNIAGSINIDVTLDNFITKATEKLNKNHTVALYCRSGRRSKNAASQLSQAGYNVIELDGGFNAWKGNGTLFITHEIKHLLQNYVQKAASITSQEEGEELTENLFIEYNNLCEKHEKEIKEWVEKINAEESEALNHKKEIEDILEDFTRNINVK